MLRKASKNKLKVSLQRYFLHPYSLRCIWKLFLSAFWLLSALYLMTHSNMFWAFILHCLSVGPPYCLHMRVKFYSSEPNNLHEELTRWIAKPPFISSLSEWILQLIHACFYRSVECFISIIHHETTKVFHFSFPYIAFSSFFQISICATVEARRPQWEVGIFCIIIPYTELLL